MNIEAGHVYFIGAGPGAPDLLTLRGRAIIDQADLIIYADSLVDRRLCEGAKPDAEIVGSAALTLEEVMERMITAARAGKVVARVQSGDPSIYGAISEQIARLKAAGIPYTIVPGVSSAFAAAARLGIELTVPEIAQTVIFTRHTGRASPVPERESLAALARHQTTLILFLSVGMMSRVVAELLAGGYPPDTPIAVLHRVTWPDEAIVRGTLSTIVDAVRRMRWKKQAIILVGPAIGMGDGGAGEHRSRLYRPDYSHRFRRAKRPAAKLHPRAGRESSGATDA